MATDLPLARMDPKAIMVPRQLLLKDPTIHVAPHHQERLVGKILNSKIDIVNIANAHIILLKRARNCMESLLTKIEKKKNRQLIKSQHKG